MVFIALNPSRAATPPPTIPRAPARWGMLVLALGAGLAAALLAFLLVRSHTPAGTAAPESLSVAAASGLIPARTRLTAALLQSRLVPVSQVPEGAFADPQELVGKITVQSVPAGSVVTKAVLALPGTASGLAFALPPSQRAVTIALDPADGIDAFAYPGDHVDILVTDEPGAGPAETRTVLQNIALLAVGTKTAAESSFVTSSPPAATTTGASHVTVGVLPLQAQALVLAAARGKIHLSLRSASDNSIALMSPALPVLKVPAQTAVAARPKPHHRLPPLTVAEALPSVPLSPLPVFVPKLHPATVSIMVIKGSQSQTVSVAP